jgi:hypothetical protein
MKPIQEAMARAGEEEKLEEQESWRRRRRPMTTPSRILRSSSGEDDIQEYGTAAIIFYGKGLDTTLQKHEPCTTNLRAATYKAFRQNVEIYFRMCRGRGENCMRKSRLQRVRIAQCVSLRI